MKIRHKITNVLVCTELCRQDLHDMSVRKEQHGQEASISQKTQRIEDAYTNIQTHRHTDTDTLFEGAT
jgi:hypothetical protein